MEKGENSVLSEPGPGTGVDNAAWLVRRENRSAKPIRARRSTDLQLEAEYMSATQSSFFLLHKLLSLDGQVHTCPPIQSPGIEMGDFPLTLIFPRMAFATQDSTGPVRLNVPRIFRINGSFLTT